MCMVGLFVCLFVFIDYYCIEEREKQPRATEVLWNWRTGDGDEDKCFTLQRRRRISSKDSDCLETSLCSNASSLSVEDHYNLSNMQRQSSLITGITSTFSSF